MFARPVNNRKRLPPTNGKRLIRSMRCIAFRTGGHVQKWGKATHSFASSKGIDNKPVTTCRPWLTR